MDGFRRSKAKSSKNNFIKLFRCKHYAPNPYMHDKKEKLLQL